LRGLEALGRRTWAIDTGTAVQRGEAVEALDIPQGAPLLLHVNSPYLPLALMRLPRGMARGRRIIGYWAWELPTVPAAWRSGVPFVHEVWVLSHFTADAVWSMLSGRVRVVTPPVAAVPPRPAGMDRAAFGLPQDAVIVLSSFSLASSFARKNPVGTIRVFRAAFGDRSDRLLVLKVGNPNDFPADFARLREAAAGAANIQIETGTLAPEENHALTAACDIVLSLHRSEGFGLVPAEAMLLGRPVVATGWSGNMDFMDEDSAALVPAKLVPARDPRGVFEAPGAVWAEPDEAVAVAHLRRLADDPAARADLGARGRAMAEARLGLDSLREAVESLGL
ncbi:MAG TPA: glycosyltransferase family 4 protein, partial [Acidisphaera sp.]|nr:glycosyltransferase family 4 protein [Acidisphaera sp.]